MHDDACFCHFFEKRFKIFQAAPTVTSPPAWQFLLHTFWSRLGMISGRNATGMRTPPFAVLTTMLACLNLAVSEFTQTSALWKLQVWDADLKAQMSVCVFPLYLSSTEITLFSLSLFSSAEKSKSIKNLHTFIQKKKNILFLHLKNCTESLVSLCASIQQGYYISLPTKYSGFQ